MQAFQAEIRRFEGLNARVLGISSDSVETHEEFSRKHGLDFALAADESGAVQKLYAPGRVTFLIDTTGVVRYIQKGTPDMEVLTQELGKMQ